MDKVRILFVCMGNICRSPTAEAVMRRKLGERGLDAAFEVDSAGTHGWHVGTPPDRRSQAHAGRRGYDLSALRARCVADSDFDRFDLVLAMDDDNLENLQAICPPQRRDRLRHFMSYARRYTGREVPDPYSGGAEGFEHVLDLVEDACDGLIDELAPTLPPGNFGR